MNSISTRIRRHLVDPESHHRRIAAGFLWVSFFVLIGKVVGAAKEMTIAWRYGVSETVDAYVFVFNLVNWPVSVWLSVLTIVLAPRITIMTKENPDELPRFRAEFLGLSLFFGLGLSALAWIGLPLVLSAHWVGLSEKVISEGLRIAGGMSLLAPLGTVISLLSVWMLATGRHQNTLLEMIPALVILLALLFPRGSLFDPLLWGTVMGFMMHLAMLSASLIRRRELSFPRFTLASPAWQGFWVSISITVAGQLLMSFTTIIDQFFIAGLGPGVLSAASYANRILALLLGIGALAIGRATLPIFSELIVKGGKAVKKLALSWAMWMFGLSLLAMGLIWPTSHLIVRILFERGAFHNQDTEVVAQLLQYGLLQVPFYMAGLVLVSALTSMKKYSFIALICLTNLLAKLILNNYLIDTFGVAGVFFATAIMIAISASLSLIALIKTKETEQ